MIRVSLEALFLAFLEGEDASARDQNNVENPMINVKLVTLLTRQFSRTREPGPPDLPRTKANMRFENPEAYGIMSVPRTVPSRPFLSMAPRRQIIRADMTRKRPKENQGSNRSRYPASCLKTEMDWDIMLFK